MSDPSPFEIGIPGIPAIAPIPVIFPIPFIPPLQAPPPVTVPKRTHDPAAVAFFLPPETSPDPLRFRGEVRDTLKITPIIDGKEIFKELETQIAKAKSSVLIAFWALDPLMPMVTDPSKPWLRMLFDVAERGVLVRVLMNAFDPIMMEEHLGIWTRYFAMTTAAHAAGIHSDHFQIVCARHEAEVSAKLVALHKPHLFAEIAAGINRESDARVRMNIFTNSPGLWDKLIMGPGNTAKEKTEGASYPLCPAAHHQKLVIVDGKFAYTGGVNITDQYVDSQKHTKNPDPWHDVFVKVEGSLAVGDFIRNYIGVWNKERVRMKNFFDVASRSFPLRIPAGTIRDTTDLTDKQVPAVLTSTIEPKIPSQIHRTISVQGPIPLIPEVIREDILEGYIQAIKQAEQYIYIENQYFREQAIADTLINRYTATRGALRIIILLPRMPEELWKGSPDPVSKQGAFLQFQLVDKMQRQIGADLGLFTLVPNISKKARGPKELIYVHSKLFIIDDKFASVGSANLNPRSLKIDTELDFVWHNEEISKKLRIDLWKEALGNPAGLGRWKPADFISKWSDIAKKNERAKPRSQKGFVIPFKNVDFGSGNPLLTPFT